MRLLEQLAVFNSIKFSEDSHTYEIDDKRAPSSVTRLIDQYKKPFDVQKLSLIVSRRQGIPVSDVLSAWKANNLYSTVMGSMIHKYVELHYANKIPKDDYGNDIITLDQDYQEKIKIHLPRVIEMFHSFAADHKHLIPIRTELVIGDLRRTKVCGMIDMLAWNADKQVAEIYDFKTNKRIRKDSTHKEKLLPPFDHYPACELSDYTLQQNVYRHILETNTGIELGSTNLVWMNPEANPSYEIFALEDARNDAELMLREFERSEMFGL